MVRDDKCGAASRARTSDFKIFSLALSQLSYRGAIPPMKVRLIKFTGSRHGVSCPRGVLRECRAPRGTPAGNIPRSRRDTWTCLTSGPRQAPPRNIRTTRRPRRSRAEVPDMPGCPGLPVTGRCSPEKGGPPTPTGCVRRPKPPRRR